MEARRWIKGICNRKYQKKLFLKVYFNVAFPTSFSLTQRFAHETLSWSDGNVWFLVFIQNHRTKTLNGDATFFNHFENNQELFNIVNKSCNTLWFSVQQRSMWGGQTHVKIKLLFNYNRMRCWISCLALTGEMLIISFVQFVQIQLIKKKKRVEAIMNHFMCNGSNALTHAISSIQVNSKVLYRI